MSSYQPDHPATHATDDDPKGDTCYHSNISSHSWWQADLGSEKFIREIAISIKVSPRDCFSIELTTIVIDDTSIQLSYSWSHYYLNSCYSVTN